MKQAFDYCADVINETRTSFSKGVRIDKKLFDSEAFRLRVTLPFEFELESDTTQDGTQIGTQDGIVYNIIVNAVNTFT